MLGETPPSQSDQVSSTAWTALILLALVYFCEFLGRIFFAPLLVNIKTDLQLTPAQAGGLFLYLTVGFSGSLFFQGVVSARLRHRKTVALAVSIVGLALLFISVNHNLSGLRMGLVMLGLGSGLYPPSGLAVITSLFPRGKWGRALAIHEAVPSMAFILAPLLAEGLLHFLSWRGSLAVVGVTALVVGATFFVVYPVQDSAGVAPQWDIVRWIFRRPTFWLVLLLFSLLAAANIGVYRMLPLYLVSEQGMSGSKANLLISLSRISGLLLIFGGGVVMDKIGIKKALAFFLATAGLFTALLGILSGTGLLVTVFLQPVFTVCLFPAGLAAVTLVGGFALRNVAISLTLPLAAFLGSGAFPAGLGYLAGQGIFGWGFIILGLLMILGVAITPLLKLETAEPDALKVTEPGKS